MADFRMGSMGQEVRQIQTALAAQQLYGGPIDGAFGGGTAAAVRAFQRAQGLPVDAIVGQQTWAKLFPGGGPAPAVPVLAAQSIEQRCLALTGSFETNLPPPDCFAGLSGDFDRMGISFGALQWNLGSASLQPILLAFDAANAAIIDAIFGDHAPELRAMLGSSVAEQLEWARSIQNGRHQIAEPWHGFFKTLGRNGAFIAAQSAKVAQTLAEARTMCAGLGIMSERALALAFDIKTQNGSISPTVRAQIAKDIEALPTSQGAQEHEQAKLEIIANRRADAALPEWREDVRKRKLTIARGSGTVHGRFYDLAGQYGITLAAMPPPT